MLAIYQTPLDFLYLVLSVSVGLLAIFLILFIYNLIRIVYNLRSVTEKAHETMDLINHYLYQPIKFLMKMMEKGNEPVQHHKKRPVTRDQ